MRGQSGSREVESSWSSIQLNPGLGEGTGGVGRHLIPQESLVTGGSAAPVLHNQLAVPPILTAQFYRDVREAVAQA